LVKRHSANIKRLTRSRQRFKGGQQPLARFKSWGLSIILVLALYWGIPAVASEPSIILAQNSTSTPTTRTLQRPTLQVGSEGSEVSELQATLKLLGYYRGSVDGMYSEETAAAVSAFQKAAGLAASGVVDQQTWNRLFPPNPESAPEQGSNTCVCPDSASGTSTASNSTTENSRTQSVNFPILQLGMRGEAVRGLQERLKAKGFLESAVDGVFGPETQAAVQAAQAEYELKPDGIVGTQTWLVLLR
jgi:N-acetylmuramoyl-L-alanine amidase